QVGGGLDFAMQNVRFWIWNQRARCPGLFKNQQRHMAKFSRKNVVVEVKHPRRLKKAGSSIWGGIDMSKHSKDVSHLVPGAPVVKEHRPLRVKPPQTIKPSNPPVQEDERPAPWETGARILEDKEQLAWLKEAEEAEK